MYFFPILKFVRGVRFDIDMDFVLDLFNVLWIRIKLRNKLNCVFMALTKKQKLILIKAK